MAYYQSTYFAQSLQRQTTFAACLPNDVPEEIQEKNHYYKRTMKTLYLLHGYSGYYGDWVQHSKITDISLKYNLAVIMPDGDNSFYLNWGGSGLNYEQFVGEDLIDYTRKAFSLSPKKEDTYIGGLSMGGYGAIHTALAHPEIFGKAFGLSSALLTDAVKDMKPGQKDAVADYAYYKKVFGNLESIKGSHADPKKLVEKNLEAGVAIPPLYMACGTEDFLLEHNRKFRDYLRQHEIDVMYKEDKGTHDWDFWNANIEEAVQWLLEKK